MESKTYVDLTPILFSGGVILYAIGWSYAVYRIVKNFEQSVKKAHDHWNSAIEILENARKPSDNRTSLGLPTLTTGRYKNKCIESVISEFPISLNYEGNREVRFRKIYH